MSAWVECFVSVRFDLDIGPKVEHVSPRGALTDEGERLVAQAAFPDCNPDCGHEFIFFFTVRDSVLQDQTAPMSSSGSIGPSTKQIVDDDTKRASNGSFPSGLYGLARVGSNTILDSSKSFSSSPSAKNGVGGDVRQRSMSRMGDPAREQGRLLGVAHYRQKRDTSVPRGYVQQVFLLLSRLPYLVAHELILRVVAPRCSQCCHLSPDTERTSVASAMGPVPSSMFAFDASFHPAHATQVDVLDQAYQELAAWPSPHPHVQYSVSLLHQSLSFVTPPRELRPIRGLQAPRSTKVVLDDRVRILDKRQQSRHSQDFFPLYHLLGDHLADITKIWELLISHEHLLILSNTPSMSSAAALAVVSLIMPIKFVGDLRSYFTVQDADFTTLSKLGRKETPFPTQHSVVVSGTNPFFVRAFSGWKHMLSVTDQFSHRVVNGRGLAAASGASDESEGASPKRNGSGMEERTNSSVMIDSVSPRSPTPTSTRSSKDAWASLQWGFSNIFQTHHTFVLNHKDQATLLQERVSQCLKLPAEVQRLSTEEAANSALGGGAAPAVVVSSPTAQGAACSPSSCPSTSVMFPTTLVDEMVRRFFLSLTTEFLAPIRIWFEETVKKSMEPFQLCCSGILDTPLFHHSKFLVYLKDNRKSIAPRVLKDTMSHSTYKVLYERFGAGVLFRSFVNQLASQWVERELAAFQSDAWATDFPSEQRRLDMFINLHAFSLIEFESQDPDLILLASATAVLTEMAVRLPSHLQRSFLDKVEMLRLP
jgi:hypothetical protein